MIDRESLKTPNLTFSDEAKAQLSLLHEIDHTLAGKKFRIQISGKGCDGFSYSAGFTEEHHEDILVKTEDFEILVDIFSAFYLEEAFIDYVFDFENGTEGFVISNKKQDSFAGKFWKADPDKIPPQIKNQ
jgi:iron-sulfur cluster assembly accessory protein